MAEKTQKPEAELYSSPAVKPPTLQEVSAINDKLRFGCSEEDLKIYHSHMIECLGVYQAVNRQRGAQLPAKYPRTSGYRPSAEENPENAWYWKCDIKGAATGKLAGYKIGIKDSIAVGGVPMMNGSKILEGYVPEFDATLVTRILDAGGNIVGKAACEDLCCCGSSFTCATGPIPNPYDKSRTSGGSSAGSALLVSRKEVDLAIGGDQGGSIRIPASWCGIVGLKPTYGLVPYTGCSSIEMTIDHVGPMTRTVEDCALLLEVIAGSDGGRDFRQRRDLQVPEYSKLLTEDLSGKKIGIVTEGFIGVEEDVQEFVRRAANSLREVGATVEEVSIPMHTDGAKIWSVMTFEGAYQNMFNCGGSGYFWKGQYPLSMQEAMTRGMALRPYDTSITFKLIAFMGEYIHGLYQNKFYAKSHNVVQELTAAYDKALQTCDVLIMPTMKFKARKLPTTEENLDGQLKVGNGMLKNTAPFNCTGHPALTINTGLSEGLPIGMMIIGRHFDETNVFRVAHAYEKLRDKK